MSLLIFQGKREELIYYERPDKEGPKCSDYVKVMHLFSCCNLILIEWK